jgi:hypothetical protein
LEISLAGNSGKMLSVPDLLLLQLDSFAWPSVQKHPTLAAGRENRQLKMSLQHSLMLIGQDYRHHLSFEI